MLPLTVNIFFFLEIFFYSITGCLGLVWCGQNLFNWLLYTSWKSQSHSPKWSFRFGPKPLWEQVMMSIYLLPGMLLLSSGDEGVGVVKGWGYGSRCAGGVRAPDWVPVESLPEVLKYIFCVLPNIVPCPGVWHPVAQCNGWFYSPPLYGQGPESADSGVLGSLLVIQDLRHPRRKGRDSCSKALLLSKCLESWSIMRFAWDEHAQGICGESLSDQPPGLLPFWGGIKPCWALGRQSGRGLGLQYRSVLMIMRC